MLSALALQGPPQPLITLGEKLHSKHQQKPW